jgi:hypothetical protein
LELFLSSAILLVVSLISYVDELLSEPPNGLRAAVYALAVAESFVYMALR